MSFKKEKSINIDQVKRSIKEIIETRMIPSYKKQKIVSFLFNYVSETNFLDIVMDSFKLNPEFFKGWLYEDLLRKVGKAYGNEKRKELEIDIIEKYCLFNGEKILYICKGNTSQKSKTSYRFYVDQGTLFVTTHRIIALGRLRVFEEILYGEYRKAKSFMMGLSGPRELLVLGYQFPISNHYDLKKKSRSIRYEVNQGTYIEVFFTKSINSAYSIKERRDRVFEILDKEIKPEEAFPFEEIVVEEPIEEKALPEEEIVVKEPIEEETLPVEEVTLRPMEVCKFCGANVLAGKPYCSNCGKLLLKTQIEEEVLPKEEMVVGEPIEEEILPEEELVVEEPIKEVVLPTEEVMVEEPIEEELIPEEELVIKEPVKEIIFSCIFCGMKLDKEAKFCPQCGTIVKKK